MNNRPSKELQEAIENLETFSELSQSEFLSSVAQLEVQEGKIVPVPQGTIKKTIEFACCFLASALPMLTFSKDEEVYRTILRAARS